MSIKKKPVQPQDDVQPQVHTLICSNIEDNHSTLTLSDGPATTDTDNLWQEQL